MVDGTEEAAPEGPEDGQIMAAFAPKEAGYVLVLEFEELEDLLQYQEGAMGLNRKTDEEGRRVPERVRTAVFGRALVGRRELFSHFDVHLVAVTHQDKELAELARRDWSAERSVRAGPSSAVIQLAEAWTPSSEQLDWAERWRDEALETHPAGVNGPRVYTSAFTRGFNSYVSDYGRDDLRVSGVGGGRAVIGLVQTWFETKTRRDVNGNNPHIVGVQRKAGAKTSWLPGSFR